VSGRARLQRIRGKLARIERAVHRGATEVLDEYGGLQGALKRSVALEKEARRQAGRGGLRRAHAWRTKGVSRESSTDDLRTSGAVGSWPHTPPKTTWGADARSGASGVRTGPAA
jgi:hypothetical protein